MDDPHGGLGMRLSSKMFLSSALVIVVLASISALSLGAVGRLASVNRETTTRTIPAMSLTASARDAIPRLLGLETRVLVIGDTRYARAWSEMAARIAADLEQLAELSLSEPETRHRLAASAAFQEYRRIVGEEQALLRRGDRAGALRLSDNEARGRADEIRESLDGLTAAIRIRVFAAQAEATRLEARTWSSVMIAFGGAVALALLATAFITRRMTRSLRVLSSATGEIAAGAFREPIVVESHDEIGALASSFNRMASQLRETEDAKQQFFAIVSHELRSPLTSIRGAVDLLHERAPEPLTENQHRLTEIIAQSSERLLRLANQILEMSRLRAGFAEIERKPLDLSALVERVVEELHPQAEEAGLALERERYGSHFAYLGDEERLYQLVVNLGANAIRFTPRGGRVTIRIIDASTEFEIQVEDTGVGIPADALPAIFDPYRQAHRDRGGTGLGLAIVKGVAAAHGGHVTAESREGKGSRFTVLLPRS
jgi:signal transduction histidine kinase